MRPTSDLDILVVTASIWTTLMTGEILPKDQAADWAHVRAAYRGEEREDWSGLAPGLRPLLSASSRASRP
ncbi:aminoglycoside adenylyltransferase domain-containing protein [Azospirillum formosense]|uniref:aminoglycoside adenylyltransferase domain-containing protein n=1 Tax=Azospirillum formosense TaxID=861533 RepID=UPI00338F4A61